MRIVFLAVEVGLLFYLLYFIITQIIVPLQAGVKLFPAFRSKDAEFVKLRTNIAELETANELDAMMAEFLRKKAAYEANASERKNNDDEDDLA